MKSHTPAAPLHGVAEQAGGPDGDAGQVAATQTLSAPDATQVTWTRGGSSPEVSQVTFEKSTDSGATWTPLGNGTRIGTTPNWQRTGLALPGSGQLRARGRTSGGYFNGGSGMIEQLAAYSFATSPEIAIEQPAPTNIPNAGSIGFGSRPVGNASTAKVFTIRNTGTGDLTITAPSVSGGNAGDFAVNNAGTLLIIPAAGQTTFTVGFTPGAGGARTATVSIPSDDADDNPFTNANSAGLYNTAQVQALNVGTPLMSRDAATGKFKLTLGLEKATSLSPTNWLAFPFTGAGTSVNGLGGLEFEFTAPDNAAFFRIEAH